MSESPKSPDVQMIVASYQEGMTIRDIAEKISSTYSVVRRILLNAGVSLRSISQAREVSLEKGKSKMPAFTKKHTEETKKAISDKVSKFWEDPEKLKSHSKQAAERWHAVDDTQREEFLSKAWLGMRKAAEEGSRIERDLLSFFSSKYQRVSAHVPLQEIVLHVSEEHQKTHVDLLIRDDFFASLGFSGCVVEVDGPTHFEPIWGEENLTKTQKTDIHKNTVLSKANFLIVRVRCPWRSYSKKRSRLIQEYLAGFFSSYPDVSSYVSQECPLKSVYYLTPKTEATNDGEKQSS